MGWSESAACFVLRHWHQPRRLGDRRGGGNPSHLGPEAPAGRATAARWHWVCCPAALASSAAFGVSADGSVVVGYGRVRRRGPSSPNFEAFRWTSDSGMVGLGDLPGGLFESYAFDVSGDGSVVVGYGSADFGTEAFLWTSDGGMKRLWDVLLVQGVDPAADGWTKLEVASGISADGNTIVGWGTRNGYTEAFVAVIGVVPEPAAGASHCSLSRRARCCGAAGLARDTALAFGQRINLR